MCFEKLIQQHRVHGFVANRVDLTVLIAYDQIGIHLFHFLRHQAKLWDAFWINRLLIAECNRLECEDRFAGLVHWLDRFLKTRRGGYRAELTVGIYDNWYTSWNNLPHNASDIGGRLCSHRADTNGVGLGGDTLVANIDII